MIAALPMYDRPETAGALDRLWAGVRDLLRDRGHPAPDHLTRGRDPWAVWEDPDLVLGQTCGLPYRTRLHDRVALLGGGDWSLPDTPPGHYHSVIVMRAGEGPSADGLRLAINGRDSQSGWAAALHWADGAGLRLGERVETGAHVASAAAVADGQADVAAIDAVTWRGIVRFDEGLASRLSVVDRTRPTPGLPFIAGPRADAAAVRIALSGAIATLAAWDRETLGLRAFAPLDPADYLAQPSVAADASA